MKKASRLSMAHSGIIIAGGTAGGSAKQWRHLISYCLQRLGGPYSKEMATA
jgi:hypothetical protein